MLTPADDKYHVDKHAFTTPFVCGARDLGEALRRIAEGAAMIRSKGEAGSGNIVEAVRHMRAISDAHSRADRRAERRAGRARARSRRAARTRARSRAERQAPGRAVLRGRRFDAGRCGADDAARRRRHFRRQRHLQVERSKAFAKAIVDATTQYNDAEVVLEACRSLGASEAMPGIDIASSPRPS